MDQISGKRGASETRDGMIIDWDVPIVMDDGVTLRADVFRPLVRGQYPAIVSYGPYAKWLTFQEGYQTAWEIMIREYPEVLMGSSNAYQSWEIVDPEKWVPDGYVIVRVDSRGAGRSPGYIDPFSPRETKDFSECIEWAAMQNWSNGKIGLAGISYYAINQWHVAALQPPHLSAICAWEGAGDWYRDKNHHGGILCTFQTNWYDMQVKTVQHGLGGRGPRSTMTGDLVCGPETLSDEELANYRCEFGETIAAHSLDDDYHRARSADWNTVKVPLLSCGNWGGHGLHLRGNVEGFTRAASTQKWLEVHTGSHWALFYTDYAINLQKRFFGHFLKGEKNGWDEQPQLQLHIRNVDGSFVERHENEWPLARTQWTKLYLDCARRSLGADPVATDTVSYDGMGEGVTFLTAPLTEETEITGPVAAKLFISSSTTDADIFLILRVFAPDDKEVVFQGAIDPHTPVAQGWLRASHRKLDKALTTAYRPYHTHDERRPLRAGDIVELDIEIWPTSIVVPRGYRIGLSIQGKDYVYPGPSGGRLSNMKNEFTGCGPFLHDDPQDRPANIFGGRVTLHNTVQQPSYLYLPIIPPR